MTPEHTKDKKKHRPAEIKQNGKSLSMDIQHRRILGAALKTFSYTGYLGTKVSTIAAEAGISYGLVHHYFGSKEQLFTTIVESGLNYLQETRRLALMGSEIPEEQLRRWAFSVAYSLGQANVYLLYSRLIMQILGAPGMHPTSCVQTLDQFTQTEINTLSAVLVETGRTTEQAATIACLAFNTLLGSQMFGMRHPDHLRLLYKTGCQLMDISSDPFPEPVPLPPLPWVIDDVANPCCQI